MGRFFFAITAAYAEMERRQIGERTANALQHKRRHSRAYAPVPYGFVRPGATTLYGKGGEAELVRSNFEAEVIGFLKAWRASGYTLRQMAAELNRLGYPTKRGGRMWHAATVGRILERAGA
jgi:DNA invertase Pin-like site-specific DNA recombinase